MDRLYQRLKEIEAEKAAVNVAVLEAPTAPVPVPRIRSPLPSIREIDRALIDKYGALPAPRPYTHGGKGIAFVPVACTVPDLRGKALFPCASSRSR